jgi:hypothetical protein
MRCSIKEYQMRWSEDRDDIVVRLNFIAMKMVFFRRSFDKGKEKKLNFLPYFANKTSFI